MKIAPLLLVLLAGCSDEQRVEYPENPTDGPAGPPTASTSAPASPAQLPAEE